MRRDIRLACAVGVLLGVSACDDGVRLGAAPGSATRVIVVTELFTSEGCSSCPPADEILSQLVRRQPIPGVEVLALGEHVDYWDRLGWRDPFSSAAFSARQAEYEARVFPATSSYTPQLIIDGHLERVGSDVNAVHEAIQKAAQAPKMTVGVAVVHLPDSSLRVELHVEAPADLPIRDSTDILVAVTEDNLTTDVRRGENGGRTLKHSAVARSLTRVGALTAQDRTLSMTTSVPWATEWKSANVRVIVFLQERGSRRIVGAGSTTISS